MLLKVLAGVLVAVAVVLTGAALTGHYTGYCPFSSGCCGTAPTQTVSESSCCTEPSDCCTTSSDVTATDSTGVKKTECCEEGKVAGSENK